MGRNWRVFPVFATAAREGFAAVIALAQPSQCPSATTESPLSSGDPLPERGHGEDESRAGPGAADHLEASDEG